MPIEPSLGDFHRHTCLVRIRHNRHALPKLAKVAQEIFCSRQEPDHVIQLTMQRHDIDSHPLRPIMQIGPGQFAFDRAIHRHQPVARVLEGEAVKRRITTRQLLFEKEIVEMAVEQSPVHVEEDIVDLVPIEEVLRSEC